MKYMIYVILDISDGRTFPLYVGRGRTRYGDGKRKGWSRIDVHKRSLERALEAPDIEMIQDSLYKELVRLIRAGAQLEFRVIKETDDDTEAVMEEAKATELYRSLNPDLLNVGNISGNGSRPNRKKHHWSDGDREALSVRMTGKTRGHYNISDEGRQALQEVANANRKKLNLSPDQVKERTRLRAAVNHEIRAARRNGQDTAPLIQRLTEIDTSFGVETTYRPKTYSNRPRANMSLEKETEFLSQFNGKAKIADVKAAFEQQFGKTISIAGTFDLMVRHNVARSRSRG